MGCWNETCAITNLPIKWGDRTVGILLKNTYTQYDQNGVYPDDVRGPVGFPLFGEYDDYGGLEKVTTHPWNKELLKITDEFRPEQPMLFIHEGIYRKLIQNVGSRIPVGQSETYREGLRKAIIKRLDHTTTTFSLQKPFQIGNTTDYEANKFFCTKYKNSTEEERASALEQQIDCELFYHALVLLRKGYGTISGTGSQADETALHMIVARFIIDHIQETAVDKKDGDAETIYFFK